MQLLFVHFNEYFDKHQQTMSLKVISKIRSGSDPDPHFLMKLDSDSIQIREKTVRFGSDPFQSIATSARHAILNIACVLPFILCNLSDMLKRITKQRNEAVVVTVVPKQRGDGGIYPPII